MYVVLFGIGMMGFSVANAEEIKPLFMRDKKAANNFYFSRSFVSKKSKLATIVAYGAFVSKKIQGPGIYSVTFAVDESDKRFQYHQHFFVFYLSPPVKNKKDLGLKIKKGVECLSLCWRKSGKIEFYKHNKDGKKETLGIWIKPGPKKTNAYTKDTFVTMNVVVPKAGDDLKIYFNKPAQGEPDCEFVMPDFPVKGQFGFYNAKGFSKIKIKDIYYKPAK